MVSEPVPESMLKPQVGQAGMLDSLAGEIVRAMALTLAIHCPTSVRKENEAFLIKGVDTFLCTRPFGRRNPTKNKTVRGNPKRTISYSGWSGLLHL